MFRNKIFKTLLTFGSVFFLSSIAYSQSAEIGAMLGGSFYKGEISKFSYQNPRPGFEAFFKYNFNSQATIRTNLHWSQYAADDQFSNEKLNKIRNISAKGEIGEFALMFEYNYFPIHNPKFRYKVTPYLFGGIALFSFGNESNSLEIKEVSNLQPSIPFGIGIKYVLNPMWTLNTEFGARKTFTDYLDQTSNKVNSYQYGFYEDNDWYYFVGVGISYTFYRVKCPDLQH